MSPVCTEDNVLLIQVSTDARGDGFLTHISVAGSMNKPSLITASELFFRLPYDLHRSVKSKGSCAVTGHLVFVISH